MVIPIESSSIKTDKKRLKRVFCINKRTEIVTNLVLYYSILTFFQCAYLHYVE